MLRKKELLEFITFKLSHLKATVATQNVIHFFDLNVVAEDFFATLLNIVYGYSLVNLNHRDLNAVAIDLGDASEKLAIQVTSERSLKKIQRTVDKFAEHELSKEYESLKVLIIGERTGNYTNLKVPKNVSFSGAEDVIDIARLIKDISALDVPTLEEIVAMMEAEMKDSTEHPKANQPGSGNPASGFDPHFESTIYVSIAEKWAELADLDGWDGLTSCLVNSCPWMMKSQYDNCEELLKWLDRIVYPSQHSELQAAFKNFEMVLTDLLVVFSRHVDFSRDTDTRYLTQRFYQIIEYNGCGPADALVGK